MRQLLRFHGIYVLLLLLLPACAPKGEEVAAAPKQEKVTNVSVVSVTRRDLQETFTLPGSLEAWEDLTLAAEIPGVVRWIGPAEGELVRAGQALLRLDTDALQASLAAAAAEYEMSQKQLERARQLSVAKFFSQQELDAAEGRFKLAEASLQQARVALTKSTLVSPVDGVLDRLLVDRGEYVGEGKALAVVVQVRRLKVLVDVPEKDVSFLRVGARADLVPAAIDGRPLQTLTGEIIHVGYQADPVTRTYRTKIAVDNREGRLRPGMILRVGLVRRELPQALAVPLYAVVERSGANYVFLQEDGRALERPVRTGAVLGAQVLIESGLAGGEQLIVQGQQLVSNGSAVQVAAQ